MKKILYIFITMIFVASCSSFLERSPSTSLSTSIAIESVEDIHNAINGVYYLVSGRQCAYGAEVSLYGDALGPDNLVIGGSNHGINSIARRVVTPVTQYTQDIYYWLYKGLANVNYILSVMDNVEGDEVAGYKAEIMGLRGLFHFELLRMYAQIPTTESGSTLGIVLSTEVYLVDYIGARATLDASYAQVISDLTTSIDSGQNKGKTEGRMNYWAALGVRARAYLYMGKYPEALADAKAVIDGSPYKLQTIENYVGSWNTTGADESIFEMYQTTTYNAQRYAIGYYTNPDGYAESALNEDFYKMITKDPKDIRSKIVTERGQEDGLNKGYYGLKYMGQGKTPWMYANNARIMRLSEVYLIAAEAALDGGSAANAAGYINTLRKNRIEGYGDVAAVTELDILNERRIELFNEGHIAFDYWRNKVKFSSEFFKDNTATPSVLPIPQREIDMSGDVLVQNP